MKDDYDGAEPSGNSVATLALLKLAAITGRDELRKPAETTLRLFAHRLQNFPQAMPFMLHAVDFWLDVPRRVVVAGRCGGCEFSGIVPRRPFGFSAEQSRSRKRRRRGRIRPDIARQGWRDGLSLHRHRLPATDEPAGGTAPAAGLTTEWNVAELFWDSFRAMSASIESGSSFNPQIFIKSSARILFQGRHGICAGTSVTRRISMKFSFEVGELEKHRVEFNFNQLCGTLLIRVDNKPVHRATRLLNEPVHEVFDFMVG